MMEITLTTYQSQIFKMVEDFFSSKGYLGKGLFEDTYVLQKKLAEYIVSNVSLDRGSESDLIIATRVYNRVLGIQFDASRTQTEAVGVDVRVNPNNTRSNTQSVDIQTTTDNSRQSGPRLVQGTALVN